MIDVFASLREAAHCEESRSFTLHRADAEIIAAGATPTELVTTFATGAAGDLTLERTSDDARGSFVRASLGDASRGTVATRRGSSRGTPACASTSPPCARCRKARTTAVVRRRTAM
jgi:hypothetical protein